MLPPGHVPCKVSFCFGCRIGYSDLYLCIGFSAWWLQWFGRCQDLGFPLNNGANACLGLTCLRRGQIGLEDELPLGSASRSERAKATRGGWFSLALPMASISTDAGLLGW